MLCQELEILQFRPYSMKVPTFALVFACAMVSFIRAETPFLTGSPLPPVMNIRMTSVEYQTTSNKLANEGYRLKYLSGYTINEEPRFAGIWESSTSSNSSVPMWVAKHNLSSTEYQIEFDEYVSQGYRLVLVNGYTTGGEDR